MLLPFLEQDEAFARDFFERLRGRLLRRRPRCRRACGSGSKAVARRVRERPLWFTSSWGATETSPAITSVHWRIERAGCIGAPLPGVELKFVPNGDKLEMRVRGPNVFPGYRDAPELTAQAFDDEGYYRIGDAGQLVDEARPERGVMFDGRVAEDFKLMSAAPGCRWARCGCARSARCRRWPPTWWSPATTASRSACWCSRHRRPAAMSARATDAALARRAAARWARRRLVADAHARAVARRAAERRRR